MQWASTAGVGASASWDDIIQSQKSSFPLPKVPISCYGLSVIQPAAGCCRMPATAQSAALRLQAAPSEGPSGGCVPPLRRARSTPSAAHNINSCITAVASPPAYKPRGQGKGSSDLRWPRPATLAVSHLLLHCLDRWGSLRLFDISNRSLLMQRLEGLKGGWRLLLLLLEVQCLQEGQVLCLLLGLCSGVPRLVPCRRRPPIASPALWAAVLSAGTEEAFMLVAPYQAGVHRSRGLQAEK